MTIAGFKRPRSNISALSGQQHSVALPKNDNQIYGGEYNGQERWSN